MYKLEGVKFCERPDFEQPTQIYPNLRSAKWTDKAHLFQSLLFWKRAMGITAPEKRESVRHLPICFSKELYTNCLVCCNKACHVPPICQVKIRSESRKKKKNITSGCFLHQWPFEPPPSPLRGICDCFFLLSAILHSYCSFLPSI